MRTASSIVNPLISLFLAAGSLAPLAANAAMFTGKVTTSAEEPVAGAMVTFRFGSPFQERTVFSADDGNYRVCLLYTSPSPRDED